MPSTASLDRRERARHGVALFWNVFYRLLRALLERLHSFWTALGAFLVLGGVVAAIGTWAFVEIAGHVRGGRTQAFDEAVLRGIHAHHTPFLDTIMVELTMLGTWVVVLAIVGVAGMFLYLTRHKFSALLLLVSTTGSIVLNNVLKLGFQRPRPQVFPWETHAMSWSFPSGHAMSATVVFGTVAYLAARLQQRHWARIATLAVAAAIIFVVCASRLYLGVHYPSDVAAGIVVGLAWAGFCMATLEGIQRFAKRNAREVLKIESPAPKPTG